MEIFHTLLAVSMFSIGAYYDWKTGMISEKLWLAFGLVAAIAYVINPPSYGVAWIMGLGALVALAGRLARLYATGDFEALLTLSFILPVFNDVPIIIPVLFCSAIISLLAVLVINPILNIQRSGLKLFSDLSDSIPRKFLAFFLVHKYNLGEIHAYCGEKNSNGQRTLWFLSTRHPRHVDEIPIKAGTYVGITIPLLIPLTVSLISVLVTLAIFDPII
ncbi:MAG: putative membrane protein [Cenarchaeum symbiont of Oopsacas minuta]|nr:putative membrane protein [Cenarchaeum symbiont of Oopsacas minuta]